MPHDAAFRRAKTTPSPLVGSVFFCSFLGFFDFSELARLSNATTPMFASEYSFESSWRDLQDLHTSAPVRNLKIN